MRREPEELRLLEIRGDHEHAEQQDDHVQIDRVERGIPGRQPADHDHRDGSDHRARRSIEPEEVELTTRDDEVRQAENDERRAGHEAEHTPPATPSAQAGDTREAVIASQSTESRPARVTSLRRWLGADSLVIHFVVIFALFVGGMWRLERMEAGKHHIDLAVALPPPPAPAGGPARAKTTFEHKPQRHVAKEPVQPTARVIETPVTTGSEIGTGTGSGSGSGSGSADSTGPCTEDCGETPAPKLERVVVATPITIAPVVLRGLRISGETQLQPPDTVKTAMMRDGGTRTIATFKVCLAASGAVESVAMLRPSGYPGYDAVLVDGLRAWRYRPYSVRRARYHPGYAGWSLFFARG